MNKRRLISVMYFLAGVLVVAGVLLQFVYHLKNVGWLWIFGILLGLVAELLKRNKN